MIEYTNSDGTIRPAKIICHDCRVDMTEEIPEINREMCRGLNVLCNVCLSKQMDVEFKKEAK